LLATLDNTEEEREGENDSIWEDGRRLGLNEGHAVEGTADGRFVEATGGKLGEVVEEDDSECSNKFRTMGNPASSGEVSDPRIIFSSAGTFFSTT
jgi:hypothetical protein